MFLFHDPIKTNINHTPPLTKQIIQKVQLTNLKKSFTPGVDFLFFKVIYNNFEHDLENLRTHAVFFNSRTDVIISRTTSIDSRTALLNSRKNIVNFHITMMVPFVSR